METNPHTIVRQCTKCRVDLVPNKNWSEGQIRANSYICRSCNAAKGRAFYAKNKKHVIETAKARRHRSPEKIREYWREHRARNPEEWARWLEAYRVSTYEDVERRAGRLVAACRCRSRRYGVEFDLTKGWVAERLRAGVCEVTGLPFDISILPPREKRKSRTPAFAPSLDRIERGGGYTQENTRVVVFIYNVARSDFEDQELIALAKALLH
jgi:hypothetical protein